MSHEYQVETSAGNVRLRTTRHHSVYQSIHQWIHDHAEDIAAAVGVSSVGLQIYSIFHGGRKIK
ncbi:MAG TPA: hypothetical protein VF470_02545 [Sphingomicrobium sp.]